MIKSPRTAENLAFGAPAIESTPPRRVIAPADIVGEDALAAQIDQARSILVGWLGKVDTQTFAAELLDTARSELEPDYI